MVDMTHKVKYSVCTKINGMPLPPYPNRLRKRGEYFTSNYWARQWLGYREVRGVPLNVSTTVEPFFCSAINTKTIGG